MKCLKRMRSIFIGLLFTEQRESEVSSRFNGLPCASESRRKIKTLVFSTCMHVHLNYLEIHGLYIKENSQNLMTDITQVLHHCRNGNSDFFS